MPNLPITINQFASDKNLLDLQLWPKQAEILSEFWQGNYAIAVWALGRRSGKTLMASTVAIYAACMLAHEYKKYLRAGENFYIVSVANTIDQAKIALQKIKDSIKKSSILAPLITRETTDTLELSNGAVFKALPASSRGGRGLACPLIIFDEIAHAVDSEASNAAGSSLYQALSPATAQFGSLGKILLLSSPWIQQGIFWDLFKQGNSGNHQHIQIKQLPTWEININISSEFLERERQRDPELFSIEYGANFTKSLSSFLDPELIELAINYNRGILPPKEEFRGNYLCALDPAKGGQGQDNYTACITHTEDRNLIVDKFHQFNATWLDENNKKQINISEVENWILEQDRLYGFSQVCLDQYNSMSSIQRLSGLINIKELTWSSSTKTSAYSRLRELFNAGSIELYPHNKAIQELKNLTVIYRSGGTWTVTGGARRGVDDFVSSLAACIFMSDCGEEFDFLEAMNSDAGEFSMINAAEFWSIY